MKHFIISRRIEVPYRLRPGHAQRTKASLNGAGWCQAIGYQANTDQTHFAAGLAADDDATRRKRPPRLTAIIPPISTQPWSIEQRVEE